MLKEANTYMANNAYMNIAPKGGLQTRKFKINAMSGQCYNFKFKGILQVFGLSKPMRNIALLLIASLFCS